MEVLLFLLIGGLLAWPIVWLWLEAARNPLEAQREELEWG
ncbi:hypothetical protein Mrose_03505 [Calidithermus roseus]|uniref:Uncharacterized protein n=1 Tax=Calidithermus roseus TaxID=1644118 RepID=A0A399EDQ1_9DEIN|nr:hypothetical protein Mrose_03505 [Calidithermus roseus]